MICQCKYKDELNQINVCSIVNNHSVYLKSRHYIIRQKLIGLGTNKFNKYA